MEFDSMDDFSGSGCNDHLIIIKGHRTKRPRPPSPVSCRAVSGEGSGLISYAPNTSFTMCSTDDDHHSNETTESTIEDEIMANCLIYLAQSGGGTCTRQEEAKFLANKSRLFNEVVSDSRTEEIKGGGLFVYECKTCNRNFPSFQALGGHRASHKRPKIMVQEDKKAIFTTSSQNIDDEEEDEEIGGKFKRLSDDNISPEFTIKLAQKIIVGNQKPKIHECSFCGSEFSSGQALGGHMRRHRNSLNAKVDTTNIAVETEKPRRVFQLDLNLPAPEDDHRDLKFQFQATASALVDCHY